MASPAPSTESKETFSSSLKEEVVKSNPCTLLSLDGRTISGSSSWPYKKATLVISQRALDFVKLGFSCLSPSSTPSPSKRSSDFFRFSPYSEEEEEIDGAGTSSSSLALSHRERRSCPTVYSLFRSALPGSRLESPIALNLPLIISPLSLPGIKDKTSSSNLRFFDKELSSLTTEQTFSSPSHSFEPNKAFYDALNCLSNIKSTTYVASAADSDMSFEGIFSTTPQVFSAGYRGHYAAAITVKLLNHNLIFINNRGYNNGSSRFGITVLVAKKESFDLLAFKEWIYLSRKSKFFFKNEQQLCEVLNTVILYTHEMKPQKAGYCTASTTKALLYSLINILYLKNIYSDSLLSEELPEGFLTSEIENGFNNLKPLYKSFSKFLRAEEMLSLIAEAKECRIITSDKEFRETLEVFSLLAKTVEKYQSKPEYDSLIERLKEQFCRIHSILFDFSSSLKKLDTLSLSERCDFISIMPFLVNHNFSPKDFLTLSSQDIKDLLFLHSCLGLRYPSLIQANCPKYKNLKLNEWLKLSHDIRKVISTSPDLNRFFLVSENLFQENSWKVFLKCLQKGLRGTVEVFKRLSGGRMLSHSNYLMCLQLLGMDFHSFIRLGPEKKARVALHDLPHLNSMISYGFLPSLKLLYEYNLLNQREEDGSFTYLEDIQLHQIINDNIEYISSIKKEEFQYLWELLKAVSKGKKFPQIEQIFYQALKDILPLSRKKAKKRKQNFTEGLTRAFKRSEGLF
ncbi:MAG: hypothetical protein L7U87_07385 [Chlamydiales bacterium]|nr:hypothetical protein [Chlamydiales bacterium]